ncbi:semaphorin-5B-like [Amphibalanus amphitrite]|uniref:semaphorin-5B-like n=1 Tax=Amphibalanus amphitrite TaxID=1232801 RepID=UPI001C91A8DA|nr:semaphorin-5B-like [Amphibalanus amphitrite]
MGTTNGGSASLLVLLTVAFVSSSAQEVNTATPNDYRFVSYTELRPTLDVFAPKNVTRFSEILFDIQKYQIIVGARDHLYRLSVRGLQELESAYWPADKDAVKMCEIKGQTAVDCHNFVRVLHRHESRLLACGTHAFQPVCTWRQLDALGTVQRRESGIAVAPYSPHLNVTSVLSSEGDVFAATPTDFSGLDPALYGRKLRTQKYDSRLLSAPDFVGSFEAGDFVYFVFREDAVEYMSCGKAVYSRIARVCKNDRGNGRHVWTTFVKARLNCSVPGEYPFYLDEVQSIHYLDREEVLYATFTTPDNSLAGSAVCAFTMASISAAFQGPFQHQSAAGGPWKRVHLEDHTHFECRSPEVTSGHQLAALYDFTLTAEAVQPERPEPLLLLDGVRLTSVATDVITTKHHVSVHVLYVADTTGTIRKLSVVPRSRQTCLLEVLRPFSKPTRVLTMKLLREAASLYLGTDSGLVRLPVERCGRYRSEAACLAAMDPYCGWDEARALCTPPPGQDPGVASWLQPVTQCPDLSRPVDGGWSAWGDWQPCRQLESSDGEDEPGEPCLCRRRQCSSPAPARGGAPCVGLAAEVTNCTRHGGWTSWSAWSACSHPCGVAVKSRRRSCSSPAPVHGGRDCSGDAEQEIMCHSNPPCPSETSLPVDGGWGHWSAWSRCSARCGGGLRRRRRSCDSPRPANGGRPCAGCELEYGECGGQPCPEQRRLTHWTPWLAANGSTAGRQQRFRFECRAPVPDAALIRVSHARSDERHCTADGQCTPADWTGLGWGDWGSWSPCSVPCGGGVQTRSRACDGLPSACLGPSRVEQACNTERCKGDWSCWSEWSPCSVSCGVGRRSRHRQCRPPEGADPSDVTCDGSDVTEEPCEMPSCSSLEGWNEWSVWSQCDVGGEQHRVRDCMVSEPGQELCQGVDRQSRLCVETSDDSVLMAATAVAQGGVSAGRLVGACLGCFCAGALLAAAGTYYYLHRRRYGRVPGSKYYDTLPKPAAPNAYQSVPGVQELAELRNGRGRHSSAGKSAAELSQPEKTATIRRNGSQRYTSVLGSELRANLASDTIY